MLSWVNVCSILIVFILIKIIETFGLTMEKDPWELGICVFMIAYLTSVTISDIIARVGKD